MKLVVISALLLNSPISRAEVDVPPARPKLAITSTDGESTLELRLRTSVGMSFAWDSRPVDREDMRLRIAPEVEIKVYGVHATALVFAGLSDQVIGRGDYALGLVGGLVQLSVLLAERYEIATRYATVHILERLRSDARRAAKAVVAAQPELDEKLAGVGSLASESEVNLAFSAYLIGQVIKGQIEAAILVHRWSDERRYDL